MPEMHLRQSKFTYSACELFTKSKEYSNLKKQKFTIYVSERTR